GIGDVHARRHSEPGQSRVSTVLEGPGLVRLVFDVLRPDQAQRRTGEESEDDAEDGPGEARFSRSHAPRGNARCDAPRRGLPRQHAALHVAFSKDGTGRGASGRAFPRGAWERERATPRGGPPWRRLFAAAPAATLPAGPVRPAR